MRELDALLAHARSSSLQVYVLVSARSVDSSSMVSNEEPQVEMLTSMALGTVKL